MKKYYSFFAAVAMMFAVTSCSQEEVAGNENATSEYVSASFNINTPEGMNSRAIGDGTTVNKVVCATFDAEGAEMTQLRKVLPLVDKQAQYSIRLVKGQNYRVAFFAFYDADGNDAPEYYNIKDLKNIEIIDDQLSNIEGRDAFTAKYDIETGATMQPISETITLYRPFAQLNLGTYYDDWDAAVDAGVEVSKTKIIVSNVYKTFSAFDDAVVGKTSEMIYDLNAIPEESLKVDTDSDGKYEEYKYLALNYLLVGDLKNEKNLTDITFVWETENGKTNNPLTEYSNIPVQRNYRTNIIGWLLTNPAEFNIVIDERFEQPDYVISYFEPVVVYNWNELNTAVSEMISTNGYREIKLGADISYAQDYELNKNVAIDLNGFSLEISNPAKSLNISSNVSIKNGTIKGKVMAQSGSKITLEGVTFGGEIDGLGAEASLHIKDGSDVYVKNCTFDAKDASGPRPRPLSIDEASSGTFKFEGCIFLGEHTYNNVYVDPLNGTATLDFTNCTFNSCTLYVNFAATCSLTNLTMSDNKLPGQPTFDIKRAKGDVTAAEWAHLKKLIKDSNNSLNQCIRIHYTNNVTETYFGN